MNHMRARTRAAPAARPAAALPRVLVMTHSHPRLTRGGAENSAGALFRALKARGGESWLLGCGSPASEARLGALLTQPFGADDYLYSPAGPFEYFNFANRDAQFPAMLAALVTEKKPDIVHAHHYARFGVECFGIIRRARPAARIVLSLHEYLAICHNNGQMVKTGTRFLCHRETPLDCAQCFPDRAARDFFLRKRYVQAGLAEVDLFLSPSRFLAERYVAWGLPAAKVRVLENLPPAAAPAGDPGGGTFAADTLLAEGMEGGQALRRPLRVGFFGQISPLKGIGVLIEAARLLASAGVQGVTIELHGDATNQPPDYQAEVKTLLEAAGPGITVHGRYEAEDVRRLMGRVDAVVVPSIWWENSPLVIQEAFSCGKPVICSNIGGMAEKVRDGIDGLHFEAGQPRHLAEILAGLAARPDVLARLASGLGRPAEMAAALDAYLAAYADVMAAPLQKM